MKRWLSRFLPRLQQQLNVVAGIVGLVALILALAGFLAEGTAQTILVIAGAAVALLLVVIGVVRAWPPRTPTPEQVAGKDLPLGDLSSIDPQVPALGIIGAGAVGKTTLKKRLLQLPTSEKDFSQKVTFHVSALLRDHTAYVALLDGRGESYDQQFSIAREADIVVVLIDHNDIETSSAPNPDRLSAHHEFGVQVRDYLAGRAITKRAVHLLLNKKDLWVAGAPAEQQTVRDFFSKEIKLWEAAFGDGVTSAEHSNAFPNDTAHLIEVINERWGELQHEAR